MDRPEIRLELLKTLIPAASRVSLSSGETVERAHELEKYIINGKKQPEEKKPDPIVSTSVKKPLAQEGKPVHNASRKKRK